jgi:hypothetical protein
VVSSADQEVALRAKLLALRVTYDFFDKGPSLIEELLGPEPDARPWLPSVDDVATHLARLSALNHSVAQFQGDDRRRIPGERFEVLRLSLSSPMEMLTAVPVSFIAGGSVAARLVFAERLFTFPMRVNAELSRLRLEKERYEHDRRALKAAAKLEASAPSVGDLLFLDAYGPMAAEVIDPDTNQVIAEGKHTD